MKVKMHPQDIQTLQDLMVERNKIVKTVDVGSLKKGDIQISWRESDPMITIQGKDVEP